MERPPAQDANWWAYALEPGQRRRKILAASAAGATEVNPERDGKRLLSYAGYLGLDTLLASQVPSSFVPDERAFVVTHQLFELVFKLAIFDLHVIASTLGAALALPDGEFSRVAGAGAAAGPPPAFWLPALTASARVRHATVRLLPALMGYLATGESFDNEEFVAGFRVHLSPASAFQSAQFRLIQRALGKSPLFALRVFPAGQYLKDYLGWSEEQVRDDRLAARDAGLVRVVDPLVLRECAAIASPAPGSPQALVADLDRLAHAVLARVGAGAAPAAGCAVPLLADDEGSISRLAAAYESELRAAARERGPGTAGENRAEDALIERRRGIFATDWRLATAAENERRQGLGGACAGARLLRAEPRELPLRTILVHLLESDAALTEAFLVFHETVVARRLGEVPGTAGGGVPYLRFSRELAGRFPALVAFRAQETS